MVLQCHRRAGPHRCIPLGAHLCVSGNLSVLLRLLSGAKFVNHYKLQEAGYSAHHTLHCKIIQRDPSVAFLRFPSEATENLLFDALLAMYDTKGRYQWLLHHTGAYQDSNGSGSYTVPPCECTDTVQHITYAATSLVWSFRTSCPLERESFVFEK